jgi:hypothetical protein
MVQSQSRGIRARPVPPPGCRELEQTERFVRIMMGDSEEALGRLLDDDHLAGRNEEAVWEALTGWRRAGEGQA